MNEEDTSSDAQEILVRIYQQMSPAAKARRILGAYQAGKILAMAGLKDSYPQASEKQIWHLWARQHLGEKLFKVVYGALPDE
jgi:hypothetical protein